MQALLDAKKAARKTIQERLSSMRPLRSQLKPVEETHGTLGKNIDTRKGEEEAL